MVRFLGAYSEAAQDNPSTFTCEERIKIKIAREFSIEAHYHI